MLKLEEVLSAEELGQFVTNFQAARVQRPSRYRDKTMESLLGEKPSIAVDHAMIWDATPEGRDYWSNISRRLERQEYEYDQQRARVA